MSNEQKQSAESEDQQENALICSTDSAGGASDGQEDVRSPDGRKFKVEMDEITERIRISETKLKSLEKEMASSSNEVTINQDTLQRELQDLRALKEKVIDERKQHDGELKGLNMQVQRKNDACTKLQAGVRYKTEARIDEAIRKLEHQMQAQQLKISEEKRLVAEIDILKRSKRNLNEYLALKQLVDQLRIRQRAIRGERDACVKKINHLKSREEEIKNLLDSDAVGVSEEMEKQHLKQLNEVEALKKELDELHLKKRDIKSNFTKEQRRYYSNVKEIRAQKQKEDHDKRNKDRFSSLKDAHVSRRSKQQPYEKEKALCDTLMAHLEKLHKTLLPDVQVSPLPDKDPVPSLAANTAVEFSKSDGEGTFLRRKSATDDLVGVFAGIARTTRRGSRKGRRSSGKEVPRKLNLHPDVVENLLALSLSPPSTYVDIPKVLEELQERRDFFERAITSNTALTLPSNDLMSPITEEAAPKFPSLFKGKSEDENPEEINETENISSGKGSTEDQEDNSMEGQASSVCIQDEQIVLDKSVDKSNNNALLVDDYSHKSEREEKQSLSYFSQPQNEAAANEHGATDMGADVTEGNCEVSAAELEYNNTLNAANKKDSKVHDILSSVNGDVHVLDEPASTDSVDNDKETEKQKETITFSDNLLQPNCKTGIVAKEESFIQDLQIHSSNCTSPSPRSSRLLLSEKDLEAVYDRSLVKVQCEKCPA